MTHTTVQTALTFDVPLPPRGLSSNARGKWGRIRDTKLYRAQVGWLATEALGDRRGKWPTVPCRVSLVFGIKGGRGQGLYQPRDTPNAIDAFKAGFDGLKDAGLLVDDSARWMELGPVIINSGRGPYVQVTVEAIE